MWRKKCREIEKIRKHKKLFGVRFKITAGKKVGEETFAAAYV